VSLLREYDIILISEIISCGGGDLSNGNAGEKQADTKSLADTIFTAEELAKTLQIATRTIYDYAKRGELKGRKVGKRWIFTQQNITDFLNSEVK
jgi:excisionase family DNA binding protein